MDRLDRPQGDEKSAHFSFDSEKSRKCCFTSRRCRHWLRPRTYFIRTYSLDIRRKEAIALVGPNGIGKSTLLKSIIDRIPFIKGSKTLAPMFLQVTMTKSKPIYMAIKRS